MHYENLSTQFSDKNWFNHFLLHLLVLLFQSSHYSILFQELWEENLSAAVSLQVLEMAEKFSVAAASHSISTDYGKLDCMTSIFMSFFSRSQSLAFWKALFPVLNNIFSLHGATLMARDNDRFLKQVAFHLLRLAVFRNESIRRRAVLGLQILIRVSSLSIKDTTSPYLNLIL